MAARGRSDPGYGSGPSRYPGTFLLAFREAAAGLNWQIRRWLGHLVECVDADGHEHMVGLENLYRRARRAPGEEWPALVTEFLRTVTAVEQGEGLPTDLASVADRVLVRLGQPLQSMPDEARVWSQPLFDTGLCVNLVIDYPNRMFYVTEKLVAESGRSGDDWLQQALANLRGRTPENCFEVIQEDSGIRLCGVGDAYDSSRALLVAALVPGSEALGHFVTVPSRDEFVVLPVTPHALPHVHLLKLLAEKNYHSAPYPISSEVFWVRDGVWRLFPIEVKNNEVTVRPPDEFVELLDQLAPDEGEPDAGAGPETR